MPTALVTGSSDGIGLETARALAARAWTVLLHGRNPARAEEARAAMPAGSAVEALWGDLARLDEVLALALKVSRLAPRLDLLVLNAGVYESRRSLTPDGFERTMGINHFAHLLLAQKLRPALKAAPAARLLWVSSGVHRGATLDLDDLDLQRNWTPYGAYAASKLANAACAAEAARRPEWSGVPSFSLHPGVVGTKMLTRNFNMSGIPPAQGAETSLFCALEPKLAGVPGGYFSHSAPARPDARVEDPLFTSRLWDASLARLAPWI